jgi:xanthine/uracil permease
MKPGVVGIIIAIAGGAALALLTGLVDVTPNGLVGATWYGFPLPWLYRLIVAPQYYPWDVHWLSLILDIGFWCVISLGAALAVRPLLGRKPTASAGG